MENLPGMEDAGSEPIPTIYSGWRSSIVYPQIGRAEALFDRKRWWLYWNTEGFRAGLIHIEHPGENHYKDILRMSVRIQKLGLLCEYLRDENSKIEGVKVFEYEYPRDDKHLYPNGDTETDDT